jgi:hypothetical protein
MDNLFHATAHISGLVSRCICYVPPQPQNVSCTPFYSHWHRRSNTLGPSQQWLLIFTGISSGTQCSVARQLAASSVLFLAWLLSNSKGGSDVFLRNVNWLSTDCIMVYTPEDWNLQSALPFCKLPHLFLALYHVIIPHSAYFVNKQQSVNVV